MDPRDKNRVYIGHLPDDISAEELTSELSKFGRVRDVDIKYGRTRNGTAYAFAEFADCDGAEKAVSESGGLTLSGTRVKVEFTGGVKRMRNYNDPYARDQASGGPGGRHQNSSNYPQRSENKVIVTGLPKNTSWQDLKDHMRKAGAVGFAVVYDKGVGVVEYRDRESVQEAVSLLNNSTILTHVDMAGTVSVCLPEEYPGPVPSGNSRRRSLSPHYRRSPSPRRRKSPPGGGYHGGWSGGDGGNYDSPQHYGAVRSYRDSPPRRQSSPYGSRAYPSDRAERSYAGDRGYGAYNSADRGPPAPPPGERTSRPPTSYNDEEGR